MIKKVSSNSPQVKLVEKEDFTPANNVLEADLQALDMRIELIQALIPLGFIQAATENERVCRQFIQSLLDRGLQ